MDDETYDLIATQHGVVLSWQLPGTEMERRHELVGSGRWLQLGRHVYRLRGCPVTTESMWMAALLIAGPGAHLSHQTSAQLWGWPGFRPPVPVVQRRKSSNRRRQPDLVRIRETRRHHGLDTVFHRAFPVCSPARTLIDLAAEVHPDRIERLLEWAWNRRQLTGLSVIETLDRIGRQGRRGVRRLEGEVVRRGIDWNPPESMLEARVDRSLREAGVVNVARQVSVGRRTWIGRVDFLIDGRVVLEVLGDRFHTGLAAREDDRARFDAIVAAGFSLVTITEADVFTGPQAWIGRVVAALQPPAAA